VNGDSDLRAQHDYVPAFTHAFFRATRVPPCCLLFWGHGRALTAIPRHLPLGGAVAPPTRVGGFREPEERPRNPAWRRGRSAPAQRAVPSSDPSSTLRAAPRPGPGRSCMLCFAPNRPGAATSGPKRAGRGAGEGPRRPAPSLFNPEGLGPPCSVWDPFELPESLQP
jgi:hypothetical protein